MRIAATSPRVPSSIRTAPVNVKGPGDLRDKAIGECYEGPDESGNFRLPDPRSAAGRRIGHQTSLAVEFQTQQEGHKFLEEAPEKLLR